VHMFVTGTGLAQSVQCLTTGWTTGRSGFDPRQGKRIFPLSSVSRPALGPTQPPVQWVPGVFSPGVKRGRGVTLTTHPHLATRSGMSRSYTSSPPCAYVACSGTALLCLLQSTYILTVSSQNYSSATHVLVLNFTTEITLTKAAYFKTNSEFHFN
jgi:hypothetical protein